METLLLLAMLTVEGALTWRSISKFGYLPTPSLISVWIIGAQIVLWLVHAHVIHYAFLDSYSRGGITTEFLATEIFYAELFAFVQVSHMALPSAAKLTSKDIQALRVTFVRSTMMNINVGLLLIILTAEAVFVLCVNWKIAWSTTQYLALTNAADIMRGIPGGQTPLVLLPVAGLLAAAAAALNLAHNERGWALTFLLLVLFPFLYEVGAHSRAGAVFPFVFILTLRLLSPKSRPILTTICGLAVVTFILTALAGRSTGEHGLASLPNIPTVLANHDASILNTFLPNVFEGALSNAESRLLPTIYPPIYKLLSLSPTPSFVDGFSKIQESYQIRLSPFAPISGYVEAQDFGPTYLAMFYLLIFLSVRLVFRVSRVNRSLFMFANLFLFIGFYALNAYPVRNGLKFFWVACGIAVVAFAADFYARHGGWQNRWRREQEKWRESRLRQIQRRA